jgi:hypothetical protein
MLLRKPFNSIGLAILKRIDHSLGFELITFTDFQLQRQLELEFHFSSPGDYLILPRTTGCNLRKPDNSPATLPSLLDPS